jgi:Fe2+ or Zn2+ uptake regulation protein
MSKPLAPPDPREADFSTVDKVLALVRARGGRATTSRRILLEVLFEADGHLSAEELAEAMYTSPRSTATLKISNAWG